MPRASRASIRETALGRAGALRWRPPDSRGDTRRPASDGILPPAAPSLRGGPTSLGAITKIVITALYLLLGVALYPLIIALGTVNAAAGSAYAFVCLSLFVLVGALFLYQIWKPTRTR